jgi:DNA (cytosine-5)-methyltransferase 1
LHEWQTIIKTLRDLGYRVSSDPLVVSPHRISPKFGGRPQVRDRVLIAATRLDLKNKNLALNTEVPDTSFFEESWIPDEWNLYRDLPIEKKLNREEKLQSELSVDERDWIDAWNDLVITFRKHSPQKNLPSFPLWADAWPPYSSLEAIRGDPKWKTEILRKNLDFYSANSSLIDAWLNRHKKFASFPPSRRKFEWQAQAAKSLRDTVIQFRPSGIRVKRPTYLPALVAISQTSILGREMRRITTREAMRLQGFPEWFSFSDQQPNKTFKQLGNAVNVSVIYNVMRALVIRDFDEFNSHPSLAKIKFAPNSPDIFLSEYLK